MRVKAEEGEQLLSKVALPWRRPLSVLLQRSHDPHRLVAVATMVYRRGGRQTCGSWDQLLTSLGNKLPCVDMEGNLCFQPMLLRFPETFIQGFLHFLLSQQDCVSPDSLHSFVRQLGQASGHRSPLVQPLVDRLASLVADRCRLADDGARPDVGACDGGGGKDVPVRHGAIVLDSASIHLGHKSESGVSRHAVRDESITDILCEDQRDGSCDRVVGERKTSQHVIIQESKSDSVCRHGVEVARTEKSTHLSGITTMHSQHVTDVDADRRATLPPDLHPATLRSSSATKGSERSCADSEEADSSVIVVDSDGEEEVCVPAGTGVSDARDEADRRADAHSQVDTTPAVLGQPRRAGTGVSDARGASDHRADAHSQVDTTPAVLGQPRHAGTGVSDARGAADRRADAHSQVDTTPAVLGQPRHTGIDQHCGIEAEYKADVQRLREALSSGEGDAPGDLDLDFLAALPASQVAVVCEEVGLATVPASLLPAVLQRVVTLSHKLSHGASTALVAAIVTHRFMSMEETASRDMMSCLSDLAAAFPQQLAAVLCDCLQQAPLSSVQAEVISSVCKSWDPPALLGFTRGVCRSDRQVDQHLVTVLQSAVNRRVDLNPDDLLAVLRVLETGAAPLAADAKYGRLVLTLVRAYRNQVTSLHSAVLHSIAGVHTSLVRKSLRSLVDSLPS